MSRFRFELATPADDADLRQVMAATPMPGRIALRFRREPSFFDAADVDGRWRQIIVARDCQQDRVIGLGSRSVRDMYVNGAVCSVGYLSNLRLLPEYRGSSVMARGYRFLRKIHTDGRASFYLTTIADDNHAVKALLTSGRAHLPEYHDVGAYFTLALPLNSRDTRANGESADLQLRPATASDLPEVIRFYESTGPRRQFFPRYTLDDLAGSAPTFRGLEPVNLMLALRKDQLVGTLGVWDQRAFRQTEIESYRLGLRWTRPVLNYLACLRGLPSLPPTGAPLRYGVAALPMVRDDDPDVLSALLKAQQRAATAGPYDFLLFGIHERDPLLNAVRRESFAEYITRVYVVCFDDGASIQQLLDDRCPYLELGCL